MGSCQPFRLSAAAGRALSRKIFTKIYFKVVALIQSLIGVWTNSFTIFWQGFGTSGVLLAARSDLRAGAVDVLA